MKKLIIIFFMSILLQITVGIMALSAQTTTSQAHQAPKTKCKGTTVKGVQCKNNAKANGYCALHDPSAPTCQGITSKGEKCKRHVKKGETLCFNHKK